jgi:hypothetical protein
MSTAYRKKKATLIGGTHGMGLGVVEALLAGRGRGAVDGP